MSCKGDFAQMSTAERSRNSSNDICKHNGNDNANNAKPQYCDFFLYQIIINENAITC